MFIYVFHVEWIFETRVLLQIMSLLYHLFPLFLLIKKVYQKHLLKSTACCDIIMKWTLRKERPTTEND